MIEEPRMYLAPHASDLLLKIGESGDIALFQKNEELSYRKAEKVYAAMWPELLAPCLRALGLAQEGWIDYLFMIDRQEEQPHSVDIAYVQSVKEMGAWLNAKDIDVVRLSVELTTAYDTSVAALLPRYRQKQLECKFDLQSGAVTLGSQADYWPMGQRAFFIIAQRLLLQRILSQHGIRFPVFITNYLNCLDADWSYAVWKLIISSRGPIISIDPGPRMSGEVRAQLHDLDWIYPTGLPHFRISESDGKIEFVPLNALTQAWLDEHA